MMDNLTRSIDTAIGSNDYNGLAAMFSTGCMQALGQGEQRSIAGYFVRAAVASSTFLPAAFASAEVMQVMAIALGNLPSAVEHAADNKLRQLLFDYKVNTEEDYSGAARVLAGTRMEDLEGSTYYMTAADRCDVFVKVAECFLEEDETVEADGAVAKAGAIVESIENPEQHMALVLRYKSTYARVLDANRKFLQAASRYHDLSQSATDMIEADDLLNMLGRAGTCAILAPSGPQRHRILGHIYNDGRLSQLDSIPTFETHSTILRKMYLNQVIHKEELTKFESSLAEHQRAVMGDGLTIIERSVLEHNMIAVSKLYKSIYFNALGNILGVDRRKAEKVAATMIMESSLHGSIDQVEGVLMFSAIGTEQSNWDKSITGFCVELNRVAEAIKAIV